MRALHVARCAMLALILALAAASPAVESQPPHLASR